MNDILVSILARFGKEQMTFNQIDTLIKQRTTELKDLMQYRRSICEHTFVSCVYYDPTDYDGLGDGHICTKCRFTKKENSDEYAKLRISNYLSNDDSNIYKSSRRIYYMDDFIFDD